MQKLQIEKLITDDVDYHAYGELIERTVHSSVYFVLVLLSVVIIDDRLGIQSTMFIFLLVSILMLTLMRYLLRMHYANQNHNYPKANISYFWYRIAICSNALVRAVFMAWVFYKSGIVDEPVAIALTGSALVVAGGVSTMNIDKLMMRLTVAIFLVPVAVASFVFLDGAAGNVIALFLLAYLFFLFRTGQLQHEEFWKAVIDNERLQQQSNEIQQSRQAAEHANQAKTQFLSSMSHELRTPLNAIMGYGQLINMLDSTSTVEQCREFNAQIMKASSHLLDLVNQMLDLATIEKGLLNLQLEPVLIAPIVKASIAQVEAAFPKAHKIRIIHQVSDQRLAMLADPVRLRQIVLNLLSNAVKYNIDGGTVTICTDLVSNDLVQLRIIDTGRGIDARDFDKLFESFERLSHQNSPVEGSGIGLSVTKQLVEAMQGTIGFESKVGQGSSFWVELPRAEIEEVKSNTELPAIALREASSMRPSKILYIEDNLANTELMKHVLRQLPDIELYCSLTAEEGLARAEQILPDLIFMDINLPGMDGYAALERLRDTESISGLPVIAVSAYAMKSNIRKGIDAGFDDFVTKPFDIERLYEVLEKYLAE